MNWQPIRHRPFDADVDGDITSHASDTDEGWRLLEAPHGTEASRFPWILAVIKGLRTHQLKEWV